MNELNNVVELFASSLYGANFIFAIKKEYNYKGEKYFTFGKIYKLIGKSFYDYQGIKTFSNIRECLNELIKYSGISPTKEELIKLYNKVDSFAE